MKIFPKVQNSETYNINFNSASSDSSIIIFSEDDLTGNDNSSRFDIDNSDKIKEIKEKYIKYEGFDAVFSEDIKNLYSVKNNISLNDIVDLNGKVKKGFEIFDLNGDSKVDETEFKFFANGGKVFSDESNTISLQNFDDVINRLTSLSFKEKNVYTQRKITNTEKENLYRYIECSKLLEDRISFLPENIQEKYKNTLDNILFYFDDSKTALGGAHWSDHIAIYGALTLNDESIVATMVHELTHAILGRKVTELESEVNAYYVQALVHQKNEHKSNYDTGVDILKNSATTIRDDHLKYRNDLIKLRQNNPELSEVDIAKQAFKDNWEDFYASWYHKSHEEFVNNVDNTTSLKIFE